MRTAHDSHSARAQLDKLRARYALAKQRSRDERSAIDIERDKLKATEQAQEIIQHVAQSVQQQAHVKISSVVSRCLAAIFPEPYQFVLDFVRKRGKTEAHLRFVRDNVSVRPKTSSSGGQIDVAAFALRLACVLLSRPRRRRLIVLDEPFRFLDEDAEQKIPALLMTLAKEFNVQFILVTQAAGLKVAGKIIEIGEQQ